MNCSRCGSEKSFTFGQVSDESFWLCKNCADAFKAWMKHAGWVPHEEEVWHAECELCHAGKPVKELLESPIVRRMIICRDCHRRTMERIPRAGGE